MALSFGKPIIAPQIGCIKDSLDDAGSFLYNPVVDDGLLDAIKLSIESKQNWKEMGSHNLRLSYKFDWRSIAKQTKRIYLDII